MKKLIISVLALVSIGSVLTAGLSSNATNASASVLQRRIHTLPGGDMGQHNVQD